MSTSPTYRIMKIAAWMLFLTGLALSVSHIIDLFLTLGAATVTACMMPLFIDIPTLMGKVARGAQFAAKTRKIGLKVQLVGATLSLIANVGAGDAWGDRIAGVLIVGGYVFAEWFAENLRPASDDTKAERAAKAAAARVKAAETRAANKAKADLAKAERARKRAEAAERKRLDAELAEVAAMHQVFDETVAPVSPAALPTTYL